MNHWYSSSRTRATSLLQVHCDAAASRQPYRRWSIAAACFTSFALFAILGGRKRSDLVGNNGTGRIKSGTIHLLQNTTISASFRKKTYPKKESKQHPYRYFEVHDQVKELAETHWPDPWSSTAYARASVIKQASWLPHRRMCKDTCCVETVAISLDQDKQQLMHCRDGYDLADIHMPQHDLYPTRKNTVRFHASNFNEKLLPCLVPGTIISLDNTWDMVQYFFEKMRAKIQVPYVLVTGATDSGSPHYGDDYMGDPLLMGWYGMNPEFEPRPDSSFKEHVEKFHPLKLGLSGFNHPQERFMLPFQKINNFANPFLDKSRWNLSKVELDFDKDVFVKFGNHWLPHRQALWESLCPNTTVFNTTSCGSAADAVAVDAVYADMSRYRFGVSPVGVGWDCYRTYEMLYLGVIPIVEERGIFTHLLFEGLPVILVPNLREGTTRQDILDAIHNYITSDAFQNASFDAGWERLFFEHRRHQVLKDSGRDREILVDENGRKYYQAYHYTVLGEEHGKFKFCLQEDRPCEVKDGEKDTSWLQNQQPISEDDQNWLSEWEEKGRL
jgi:hypothetical protein